MVADVDKTEHLARMTNGARGLRQDDLSSIVPQSNLSASLAGKRKISATLAGKFGKFFGVNPSIFVPRYQTNLNRYSAAFPAPADKRGDVSIIR